MKKIISLFCIMLPWSIFAQSITINYDANGNRLTKSIITTYPQPVITGDSLLCQGDSARWFASGGTSYLWSTGSTQSSISVVANTTRFYSLTAYSSNGCSKTITRLLVARPLPRTGTISGDTLVRAGTVTAYAVNRHTGAFYDWSVTNANNTIINGYGTDSIRIHWGLTPGIELITVREQNINTQCYGQLVQKRVRIFPDTLPPGEYIYAVVYPNPAKNNALLSIKIRQAGNVDVSISDNLGRIIKTYQLSGNYRYTQHLGNSLFASAGIYYIKLVEGSHKKTIKLLITK